MSGKTALLTPKCNRKNTQITKTPFSKQLEEGIAQNPFHKVIEVGDIKKIIMIPLALLEICPWWQHNEMKKKINEKKT